MARTKYTFKDVKIGDTVISKAWPSLVTSVVTVITTNNTVGEIVAIKSYQYLNDKLARKANASQAMLIDLMPFNFDRVRHNDVWYATLTIAVQNESIKKPTYYLESIDLNEVKEIVGDPTEENKKESFIKKIKKLFKR